MTNKEKLLKLVDELSEADAAEAVDFVQWLLSDEDSLSEEELAEVEEARPNWREAIAFRGIRSSVN